MPLAEIHVHEGRYNEQRLAKLGEAIQDALEAVLSVPEADYYRVFHILPKHQFAHTPSFLGMNYSEDFIFLKVTFLVGRSKEVRLALLKALNERVVEAIGISPDDLAILLYEVPGENASFGRGLAQRAHISAQAQ